MGGGSCIAPAPTFVFGYWVLSYFPKYLRSQGILKCGYVCCFKGLRPNLVARRSKYNLLLRMRVSTLGGSNIKGIDFQAVGVCVSDCLKRLRPNPHWTLRCKHKQMDPAVVNREHWTQVASKDLRSNLRPVWTGPEGLPGTWRLWTPVSRDALTST